MSASGVIGIRLNYKAAFVDVAVAEWASALVQVRHDRHLEREFEELLPL